MILLCVHPTPDTGTHPLSVCAVVCRGQWIARKVTRGTDKKLRAIPKLEDANHAGGKHSSKCTLILTEGDSAKALAVAGLSVVGRDRFGVFPLRGKLLNVRDVAMRTALGNEEVAALITILGLDMHAR